MLEIVLCCNVAELQRLLEKMSISDQSDRFMEAHLTHPCPHNPGDKRQHSSLGLELLSAPGHQLRVTGTQVLVGGAEE